MIVSLPMYDRAETSAANDRLWKLIRNELGYGPQNLTRCGDIWNHWLSRDLLFSQTCGYPYRAKLHGKVSIIGTPDHGLRNCPPGYYYSVFVVRNSDQRQSPEEFLKARLAYNEPLSQSGWAAPFNFALERGFAFSRTLRTGMHVLSALAVASKRADIACVDIISWKMMLRYDGFSKRLKAVASTDPTPALPYISAPSQNSAAIQEAVKNAIGNLDEKDRGTLFLRGLQKIPSAKYLAVPNPPSPAEDG
ncbi:MAG: PhnD/SsuA/transferrin family substrate-binding protein [Roseovarius sp.]|nr:PhnD/SsuA/transferrin family substrate-binding protein [Roseovarius sp.]